MKTIAELTKLVAEAPEISGTNRQGPYCHSASLRIALHGGSLSMNDRKWQCRMTAPPRLGANLMEDIMMVGRLKVRTGFGCIVVSAIEVPNSSVN